MASKSKRRKGEGRRAALPATMRSREDRLSRVISSLLKGIGARESVSFDDLPQAALIQSFLDEWLMRILELVDVAQEHMPNGHAPTGRVITFVRVPEEVERWNYLAISAVDSDSVLDFNDLKWIMDEAMEDAIHPTISVWVRPSAGSLRVHTLYVRRDDDNELIVIAASTPELPAQKIVGRKSIGLLGALIFGEGMERLEQWTDLIDAFVADFGEDHTEEMQSVLASWGLKGGLDAARWDELSRAIFLNNRFIQFAMDAGRMHARRPLMEAQSLAGGLALARKKHKADLVEERSTMDQERERDRKRVRKDLDKMDVQLAGARGLVARLQAENVTLKVAISTNPQAIAGGQNSSRNLHEAFQLLFEPLLLANSALASGGHLPSSGDSRWNAR